MFGQLTLVKYFDIFYRCLINATIFLSQTRATICYLIKANMGHRQGLSQDISNTEVIVGTQKTAILEEYLKVQYGIICDWQKYTIHSF